MDLHSEMLLNQYIERKESFSKMQEVVTNELKSIVKDLGMLVNTIESRVKTEKSLKGKLELKGYKYKDLMDITDILGARVVTFYSDEVDKIAAQIEKRFTVDFENSIDKRKIYKVDQFGYMSLHYICSIPKEMYFDEAHPEINEYKFEIQLRTNLQHTWASIYHDTGYKTDVEVPTDYLRRLNRLAGLLELADNEFNDIRSSLDEYRRKMKSIFNEGNFGEVELNLDSFKEYLSIEPFGEINKRIAESNNMEIEEMSLVSFLDVFKKFGFRTIGDIQELVKTESEDAYQIAIRQFSGTDIDIMTNFTGPLALCYAYVVKKGSGVIGIKAILDTIYGKRDSNTRFANKVFEICKNMGMAK
ncbi:MAG: (p)ppGpp synthetase [Bacilli bacterium]|nr:(p)ppGpp synthetase [Bacilli bacterium]